MANSESAAVRRAATARLQQAGAACCGRLHAAARQLRETQEARPDRVAKLLIDLADRIGQDIDQAGKEL